LLRLRCARRLVWRCLCCPLRSQSANRRSPRPRRRDTMSNAIINPLSAAKPPSHWAPEDCASR